VLGPGADRVAELAAAAYARGLPVSFDPNVRLAVEPAPGAWRRAFAAVSPHARIVKMSDEDAAVVAPGVSVEELTSRLADDGALVVVTCGADGAHVATATARTHVASAVTRLVDTIGAGDAFMAALLAWLDDRGYPAADDLGLPDLTALGAYAATAAAIACSRIGADPPWAAELPTADAAREPRFSISNQPGERT
jgi:fructokinase